MKKLLLIIALVSALLLLGWIFREPILDFLPVDQSGWAETDTGRCYLDPDGDPLTGWQTIEGNRYYFHPADGHMHSGWLELDGQRYCLSAEGTLLTGWQTLEEKRIHFDENGVLSTGWTEFPEGRRYLNPDGTVYIGWLDDGGKRYFLRFPEGFPAIGWLDTQEGRFYMNPDGSMTTGWTDIQGQMFYFDDSGAPHTGWLEEGGKRYYLNSEGNPCSGWLEEDGKRYYLKEDGSAAVGKYMVGEQAFFFSSTGASFIMVNPWHSLPEDYSPNLVYAAGGRVDESCAEALKQMVADCRAAGYSPVVKSSYRTVLDQTINFNNLLNQWISWGHSYEDAYTNVCKIIAIPGTSEHHLGLAVDIVDAGYPLLNRTQATTPTQQWLMENCWNYGFILRYPDGSTDITGIIYEPWHYRYVGIELAMELHQLGGIPLETYIDNLTNDGTTCGGQQADGEP